MIKEINSLYDVRDFSDFILTRLKQGFSISEIMEEIEEYIEEMEEE